MSSEFPVKHKYLKRLILYGFLLFCYTFLTSTIYNANQEIKMYDYLIDSMMEIAKIKEQKYQKVVDREKGLTQTLDLGLAEKLKGKILLQVESNGEAWYVDPIDLKRYYLGSPKNTFTLVKNKSKLLSGEEIFDYLFFKRVFPKELAGRFVTNEDEIKEHYYILPESLLAIEIRSPNEAFRLLKDQGLGVSNIKLRQIDVGQ